MVDFKESSLQTELAGKADALIAAQARTMQLDQGASMRGRVPLVLP